MGKPSTSSKWRQASIVLWEIQVLEEQTVHLNVPSMLYLHLKFVLEWRLMRPQKFSHWAAWSLFCFLQQEGSYSKSENGDFALIITDVVYKLNHYKCKQIKHAYSDVSIWCLHTLVANPTQEQKFLSYESISGLLFYLTFCCGKVSNVREEF